MEVFTDWKAGLSRLAELLNAPAVYETKPGNKRKTVIKDVLYIKNIRTETHYLQFFKLLSEYSDVTDYNTKLHKLKKGQFRYLISYAVDGFVLYSLSIKTKKGREVEIYDPAHICRNSDDADDIKQAIEALNTMTGGKYRSTAASYARALWNKQPKHGIFGDDKKTRLAMYDNKITVDEYCRQAYHGGWCYCRPGAGVVNAPGVRYDRNSLYPWILSTGVPYNRICYEFKTEEDFDMYRADPNMCLFVHFSCTYTLRPHKLPFIRKPLPFGGYEVNSTTSKRTEHQSSTMVKTISDGQESFSVVDLPDIEIDDPVEFVLTYPEFSLFSENYKIDNFVFIDAIGFPVTDAAWYVDPLYRMKQESTGAGRVAVKTLQNAIIGCFGRRSHCKDVRYIHGRPVQVDVFLNNKSMVSVGAWITSLGVVKTVRDAQANYYKFLYSDTDSLHLLRGVHKGVDIGDNIGQYKVELEFARAVFFGEKQYMETGAGGTTVCLAGVPLHITQGIENAISGDIVGFPDKRLLASLSKGDAAMVSELYLTAVNRIRDGLPVVIPITNADGTLGIYGLKEDAGLRGNSPAAVIECLRRKLEEYKHEQESKEEEKIATLYGYRECDRKWWGRLKPSRYLTKEERAARVARQGDDRSEGEKFGDRPIKSQWWLYRHDQFIPDPVVREYVEKMCKEIDRGLVV